MIENVLAIFKRCKLSQFDSAYNRCGWWDKKKRPRTSMRMQHREGSYKMRGSRPPSAILIIVAGTPARQSKRPQYLHKTKRKMMITCPSWEKAGWKKIAAAWRGHFASLHNICMFVKFREKPDIFCGLCKKRRKFILWKTLFLTLFFIFLHRPHDKSIFHEQLSKKNDVVLVLLVVRREQSSMLPLDLQTMAKTGKCGWSDHQ
jgi:hypothetical protein